MQMKKLMALCLVWVMMISVFNIPVYADALSVQEVLSEETLDVVSEQSPQPDGTPAELSEAESMAVSVKATSAILMEPETGKILMEKNAREKRYPASITKIMTLLLVMEALDAGKLKLTDVLTASPDACGKGGSQIWLEPGETMTVDDLLKAAAVASANDACVVLAEQIAGTEQAFVEQMNAKAKELGMEDTHFENCTGLDDTVTNHITTAYDIALMSAALIKYDLIRNYTTIWMDSLRNGETELVNTNRLVRTYPGITGLKTGTTAKAGVCLSATAERDGLNLVAVVLDGETSELRFAGARAMLDWGFANWAFVKPEIDMSELQPVKVLHGVTTTITPVLRETKPVLVKKGREADITKTVTLSHSVEAPIEEGEILGEVVIALDDEKLTKYDIVAQESVPKLLFGKAFGRLLRAIVCM